MTQQTHIITNEQGTLIQIHGSIAYVAGLPTATLQEVVHTETGQYGWVTALTTDYVEVFLLSTEAVPVGTKVTPTKQTLAVPTGDFLCGKTVPSFFDAATLLPGSFTMQPLDVMPKRLDTRMPITKPLHTGTTIVDVLIPLGRGQRELIIGDRKIGKTAFLLHTIEAQVKEGILPIIALIGKQQTEIAAIEQYLGEKKIRESVTLVASHSSESPSAIFLTPFTAMAIAESFADKGKDTVVILDDLSTHAKFYRELSLLANRFPGRDSYPGDIFYTHARLLERAGNFTHPQAGAVSITCFPVVETIQRDFTGYIQTNIMGITDGHIFFDNDLFADGQRPAINISLSVSRAGKQTQSPLWQEIQQTLMAFLMQYEQLKKVAHFGTELTDSTRTILAKGDLFSLYLQQDFQTLVTPEHMLLAFALIWNDLLPQTVTPDTLIKPLHHYLATKQGKEFCASLMKSATLNELSQQILANKEALATLWQP